MIWPTRTEMVEHVQRYRANRGRHPRPTDLAGCEVSVGMLECLALRLEAPSTLEVEAVVHSLRRLQARIDECEGWRSGIAWTIGQVSAQPKAPSLGTWAAGAMRDIGNGLAGRGLISGDTRWP